MKLAMFIKKTLLVVMVLAMLATSLVIPGFVVSAANITYTDINKTEQLAEGAPVKEVIPLNDGWKFMNTARKAYEDNRQPEDSLAGWQDVNLPHTWWPTDTENAFVELREDGWYRKHINISSDMEGGQIWLEFEAAGPYARVFVNGYTNDTGYATQHYGGYTKFRVNITGLVKFGQDNFVTVRIDSHTNYTPPTAGDFSKFPGITGNVNLIYTESTFVALDDYGSSGVYVTPEVTDKANNKWKVSVDAQIANVDSAKDVTVKTVIRDMKAFENIGISESFTPFNESDMCGDEVYYTKTETVPLKAKDKTDHNLVILFDNPRLWNGKADPYRYALDFEIYDANGKLLDRVTENFGFRYYEITEDGFFLNGESYPLRGVGYHEDYEGAGSAMTKEQWDESFKIMYEMGANFTRLVHYPHQDYSYELCDRYGIVVWAEIGMISQVEPSGNNIMPEFETRSKDHLKELIRQNKNSPSIVVWGIENELFLTGYSNELLTSVDTFIKELIDVARNEDPTRLTTQTAGQNQRWWAWETNVNAFNSYPMWYINDNDHGENNFEGQIKYHNDVLDKHTYWSDKPLAFAEYGAGASPNHHTEFPEQPRDVYGDFHAEEWMNVVHEDAITAFNKHPEIWMTSVWCMFDFASASRTEGEFNGINDKGLVTRDRKIKKDAYYLYQANWVDAEILPVIHITSSKTKTREVPSNTVTVYSNLDTVELFRDGVSLGKKENDGNGIFKWKDVSFGEIGDTFTYTAKSGDSTEIVAKSGVSEVEWKRVASGQFEIVINEDKIYLNEAAGNITFAGTFNASKISEIFTSRYNAEIELIDANGEVVTSGNVQGGMKLRITAENKKIREYVLYPSSIAIGKDVTVSVGENADKIVDGVIPEDYTDSKSAPMWNPNSLTGEVTVDLGKTYILNSITLHMYRAGTSRKYKYKIYAGEKENNLKLVLDKTNNDTPGAVTDVLESVRARYVKVEFTGNSDNSPFIALYEMEIGGYILSGNEVVFDYNRRTVTLPYEWGNKEIYPERLLNDITIEGNAYATVNGIDKFYIDEDSTLVINDITGGQTEYRILFGTEDPYAGDTYSSSAWITIAVMSAGALALIACFKKRKTAK